MSRRAAASLGKMPTHVGAPFDLAVEPLERVGRPDLRPVGRRERREGEQVLGGVGAAWRPRRGTGRPSIGATSSSWARTWSASGWAKIVRMAAATISATALGTRASTLRMKWTRQRCQAAPKNTEADGVLQAEVVVGDDELDAGEAPRAAGPGGTPSRRPRPRSRRRRCRAPPGRRSIVTRRWPPRRPGRRPGLPPGPSRRWRRRTRRGTRRGRARRVAERLEVLVELGTDAAHLGLGDPRRRHRAALTRSSTFRVDTPCT